jgi:hypothetical protein
LTTNIGNYASKIVERGDRMNTSGWFLLLGFVTLCAGIVANIGVHRADGSDCIAMAIVGFSLANYFKK